MNARETFTIRADDRFMEFELTRDTSFRSGEEPDPRSIIALGDSAEAFRNETVCGRRRDCGANLGVFNAGPGNYGNSN